MGTGGRGRGGDGRAGEGGSTHYMSMGMDMLTKVALFSELYETRRGWGFIVKNLGSITKTCQNNFEPLKPHYYIVKLGFTGVNIIFLISAQKQIVGIRYNCLIKAVLTNTHNLCFEQKYEKISEIFI